MKTVLSIAGSDSSGGAGIQADLKTFCAHNVYGMTAITALTAQNTLGVTSIHTPPAVFVAEQIDAVFKDIRPDAIKIGMLANAEIITQVSSSLKKHNATNIVLDPVMIATSGDSLISDGAKAVLIEQLLPLACLVTPNLPELFSLLGENIPNTLSKRDIESYTLKLVDKFKLNSTAVLSKGGHQLNDLASDLLVTQSDNQTKECSAQQCHWLELPTIKTINTHGTGCTLSAAIASNLANGDTMLEAVSKAKRYLHSALSQGLDLGSGHGPVQHNLNDK